ncbi:MAG TPA: OsmC family protein [Phenylobacterium sp.]|nr:OsmC family protein [Phenylobacterium sp.]
MSETGQVPPRLAVVSETGDGPFGASIDIGPHHLLADEAVSAGGHNAGPDPFEFLLAGLGACTTMTLRGYATRKGWPLDWIEVRVTHAVRASDGATKNVFEREIRLEGDLSTEERARLLEIADRCPVSRTLAGGSIIQSRLADMAPVGEASA